MKASITSSSRICSTIPRTSRSRMSAACSSGNSPTTKAGNRRAAKRAEVATEGTEATVTEPTEATGSHRETEQRRLTIVCTNKTPLLCVSVYNRYLRPLRCRCLRNLRHLVFQLAVHGDGRHLSLFASFLKCELVMNGSARYFGSSTIVVTVNH